MAPKDAIEQLAANHRTFQAFVARRVPERADAEEILQTAFLRTAEEGSTIRDSKKVDAWFYRVLRNAIVDHYRKKTTEQRALAREASSSLDEAAPAPEVESVCQCLHLLLPGLKPDYAELIRRVDLRDVEVATIAAEKGMTANHVHVKLHRARAALRAELVRTCGTCAEHGCLDCSCRGGE